MIPGTLAVENLSVQGLVNLHGDTHRGAGVHHAFL